MEECKAFHQGTGSLIVFTRDTGHYSSGWFKNPQYERCLHLSLSFREPGRLTQQAEFDKRAAAEWVELFFGDWKRLVWMESPKTPAGKQLEVMHYRVFTDEHWHPILPKGEVYSREFIEKGWKSFSEQYPSDPRKEPSTLFAG
jgi:hypothetical protein